MTVILQQAQVNLIIKQLKANAIGIIPTDTVYGLVASTQDWLNCQKIKQLKKRPLADEISVLVEDKKMLDHLIEIDEFLSTWFDHLPFSVTLIGYKKEISSKLSIGRTLGVRVPRHQWLKNILTATGPIWATSVNIHQQPVLTADQDLINFGADFVVLNTGNLLSNHKPSRIYNLVDCVWIR